MNYYEHKLYGGPEMICENNTMLIMFICTALVIFSCLLACASDISKAVPNLMLQYFKYCHQFWKNVHRGDI